MQKKLLTGVALAALILPGAALAQSTGTVDFENGGADIVVTARASRGIEGVEIPQTVKSRGVLTQEFIAHQTPGQSVDEIINQLPGVSFQNNDPYGNTGGRLTIRGFSPDRISQTIDGIPVNDTGNYAIYSQEQLDSELIDQVNVSYGSTDVDSPTAAATGSTVNYRTALPTEQFGVRMVGAVGEYQFQRIFGQINTGTFTSFGTRAYIAASESSNDIPYGGANDASVDRQQYNGVIYQPIGHNGDFIQLAGTYNVGRAGYGGSTPLRYDANRIVTPNSGTGRFPFNRDERFYHYPTCNIDTAQAGVADTPSVNTGVGAATNCGAAQDEAYNPSNNSFFRISSRFTLAPGLVLTVDPSMQYVKANGGPGGVVGREQAFSQTVNGVTRTYTGFISTALNSNGTYYFGRDLNGDGDTLDQVELYDSSQTVTHRWTLTSSLRYDINANNTVRVSYSHDYGRHRQTGEAGFLYLDGQSQQFFPINDPILTSSGNPLEKRNRRSYAILDQISGEYRGVFGNLTIQAGGRYPMFKRNLHQNCYTLGTGSGNLACLASDPTGFVSPGIAPSTRQYTYERFLPSGGATFNFTRALSIYASFSEGYQVPGTDNLYQAFYFPLNTSAGSPTPEVSYNYDGGIRYTSRQIQVQISPWYTLFQNRLASAFDPVENTTVYRNLGRVTKYGLDASIAFQPIPQLSLYAFGSYLHSRISDNVLVSNSCSAVNFQVGLCSTQGQPQYALTAGRQESGSPEYTFGGRIQGNLGPIQLGAQFKRTGRRYVNDENLPIFQFLTSNVASTYTQVFGDRARPYNVVDLDARIGLSWTHMGALANRSYIQLNVTNLFDELYVGGFTSNTTRTSVPFAYIGAPRAVSASLNVQF